MQGPLPKPGFLQRLKIAYFKLISDRRRYLRVPLRVKVTNLLTDMFEHFPTTNISVGGMFLESESPYAVGTPLKLELSLPTKEEPLKIGGIVVRIMLPGSSRHAFDPGMGIQFTLIEPSDIVAIEKYVGELRRR